MGSTQDGEMDKLIRNIKIAKIKFAVAPSFTKLLIQLKLYSRQRILEQEFNAVVLETSMEAKHVGVLQCSPKPSEPPDYKNHPTKMTDFERHLCFSANSHSVASKHCFFRFS